MKPAETEREIVVALVGNPNVGKSTLFNALTGLHQHTGNWPGKTVEVAQGTYRYKGRSYVLVDLPGTYSLLSQSEEERIAAEFLLSKKADCTLILGDATCLARNLTLALQVMQMTDHCVLCVNLLDEARRRHIDVDLRMLSNRLGVPVVGTSASRGAGLDHVKEAIRNIAEGFSVSHPLHVLEEGEAIHAGTAEHVSDRVATRFVHRAEEIASAVVQGEMAPRMGWLDRITLGRWSGRMLMVALLLLVFWLTMFGANIPSQWLEAAFTELDALLARGARELSLPGWLSGILLDGAYETATQVVAVMLPPMAIFFPLFSLLEDLGYLPRAAFLMDHSFAKCGGCGKQVLTMAMGFGCNAAGVTGCRIIASPRERLIAILTNALVPCNGRFPAMIVLISLFFSQNGFLAAGILTAFVLFSVWMTLLASAVLSKTAVRKQSSHMVLEIPPFRKPRVGRILLRSLLDRTAKITARAISVAAPAGMVIWVLEHWEVGGASVLAHVAAALEPVGAFLGMSGVILAAFLLSFPANELLLPMVVTLLNGAAHLAEEAGSGLAVLLTGNGWTWKTALCTILFLMFHWPCATTCLTIRKETGSWRWTLVAMAVPTAIGMALCALVARI